MMAFDLSPNERLHPCEIPAKNHKDRVQQILNNLNLFKKRHLQTCASPSVVHAKDLTTVEHQKIKDRSVILAPFLYRANYKFEKSLQRNQQQRNLSPLYAEIAKKITIKPGEDQPSSEYPDKAFYMKGVPYFVTLGTKGFSTKRLFEFISAASSREEKVIYARMVLAKYREPLFYKQLILSRKLEKNLAFVADLVKGLASRFRFKTRNPLPLLFFFFPKAVHRVFLNCFRIRRFQDV